MGYLINIISHKMLFVYIFDIFLFSAFKFVYYDKTDAVFLQNNTKSFFWRTCEKAGAPTLFPSVELYQSEIITPSEHEAYHLNRICA